MYYYNNELPPQQGWICPKCGRVNAPWLPTCGCVSSQTSGSSHFVEISSISQDSHEITKDESQTKCNICLSEARRSRQRAVQTGEAVEIGSEVNSAAYMPEVYKISMVRMTGRSDELANVRV